MKMTTYETRPGEHISHACSGALAMANSKGQPITFEFNGVQLTASPGGTSEDLVREYEQRLSEERERYQKFPEGIAAAKKRQEQVAKNQDIVNGLTDETVVRGLLSSGLENTLSLLVKLAHYGDDVDIEFNKAKLADALEAAGYKENEHVGHEPEWFNTRERMGRYIVGQAITCLRKGLPPHPITAKFVEECETMPA